MNSPVSISTAQQLPQQNTINPKDKDRNHLCFIQRLWNEQNQRFQVHSVDRKIRRGEASPHTHTHTSRKLTQLILRSRSWFLDVTTRLSKTQEEPIQPVVIFQFTSQGEQTGAENKEQLEQLEAYTEITHKSTSTTRLEMMIFKA